MIEGRRVEAVLVAAGRSARMGFDKLSYPVAGVPVLALALRALARHPYIDRVVLVAGENFDEAKALIEAGTPEKPVAFTHGGDTRAASVAAGVALCAPGALIAIHDAARPFASEALISRVVEAAAESGAAAPALPLKDTVKQAAEGQVVRTLPRDELAAVQTPQVFDGDAYRAALAALSPADYPSLTDDCMVMERAGKRVVLVAGEEGNIKITTRADLPKEESLKAPLSNYGAVKGMIEKMRIGHGYDVHAFAEGRPLILGGVTIPHDRGLAGHSDADVLCHAVSDALLGALALGDIGRHFPDTDPAYKGADSLRLLAEVGKLLEKAGWRPGNLDATLVCQAPRLARHIPAMGANIARALGLDEGAVSVKATTEEHLGFTGREEGIAAHCVALVCPLGG